MIFLVYTYDWGLYDLFIYHLCMYLRGFPSHIVYKYHFEEGENLANIGQLTNQFQLLVN